METELFGKPRCSRARPTPLTGRRAREWAWRTGMAMAGAAFQLSEVGRGAAFGDVDNDGGIDIVVNNNDGPVRLLLNETAPRGRWLEVRLQGTKCNRDGAGARVAVLRKNQKPLWRRAH